MTESKWLHSANSHELFHHLRWWVQPPERKHRLLASAVCRQCWHLLSDLGRHAVKIADAALEGSIPDDRSAVAYDLLNEYNALRARRDQGELPSPEEQAVLIAYAVVAPGSGGVNAADDAVRNVPDQAVPVAHLIRDIFGNPFRPVTFLPEWRTSTVLALAQQMYDSRDFSAMPILADALQDAGCEDETILTHCRGPGPHVRGCWCVDACLSRS